jgi:NAD(P)-dependent dehydrogenase (short-subunit alcohol dehydrogenase family)
VANDSLEFDDRRIGSMAELRFDDRVAVITGAGRGLGREYALLLASKGAKVVVNDIGAALDGTGVDASPAQQVVDEIKAAGGEAIACVETVATAAGGQAIVDAALNRYGRIDILIPNAGNLRYSAFKDISREDMAAVLDVHLWGTFNVVRPAFPLMCKAGYGRIVLTSSISGLYANLRGVVNYAMAKTSMIGLCNVLALEGAQDNVKCNVIAPGSVTRMGGRVDQTDYPETMGPEMIAPVVAWMSHESCSITGEILTSIAGRVAKMFLAETPGVYRRRWTVEEVGRQIEAIRDTSSPVIFPPVPDGSTQHIRYSIEKGRREEA